METFTEMNNCADLFCYYSVAFYLKTNNGDTDTSILDSLVSVCNFCNTTCCYVEGSYQLFVYIFNKYFDDDIEMECYLSF